MAKLLAAEAPTVGGGVSITFEWYLFFNAKNLRGNRRLSSLLPTGHAFGHAGSSRESMAIFPATPPLWANLKLVTAGNFRETTAVFPPSTHLRELCVEDRSLLLLKEVLKTGEAVTGTGSVLLLLK